MTMHETGYLPAATHSYLDRAAESLREAALTAEVPARYALAHVAALRATAGLLAARARPVPGARRRPQKNAWVLLAEVAPEFAEWATFFAAGAGKRAAAEAGSTRAVTEREADDLLRDADRFLALVESSLGLTRHVGASGARRQEGARCLTASSTSTSPPASRSSTAPRTPRRWSSGRPSRRWTPSR